MAMQDMNDQVQARLAKLAKFKEMGIEAYPHKFTARTIPRCSRKTRKP